jgi:hypothetical protein
MARFFKSPRWSRFAARSKHSRLTKAICDALEPRRLLSSVSGTVFRDDNTDGILNAGEQGLGGHRIFSDIHANSIYYEGEPTAISAEDGTYTLDGLAARGRSLVHS